MADRPRFFDDLAGVAGGAFSVLAGAREEIETTLRARLDEMIRRLDLVRREELEAVQEIAARARAGQEAAEARLAALEARVAALAPSSAPADAPPARTSPAVGPSPAAPAPAAPSLAASAGPASALPSAPLATDGAETPPAALPGEHGAAPVPPETA